MQSQHKIPFLQFIRTNTHTHRHTHMLRLLSSECKPKPFVTCGNRTCIRTQLAVETRCIYSMHNCFILPSKSVLTVTTTSAPLLASCKRLASSAILSANYPVSGSRDPLRSPCTIMPHTYIYTYPTHLAYSSQPHAPYVKVI